MLKCLMMCRLIFFFSTPKKIEVFLDGQNMEIFGIPVGLIIFIIILYVVLEDRRKGEATRNGVLSILEWVRMRS